MRVDLLKTLNAERAARRAVFVVTNEATGEQRLVKAADIAGDPLHELLEAHRRSGKSGMEETPQGEVFLNVHVPPTQLVITGAVHISQALAPIASPIGAWMRASAASLTPCALRRSRRRPCVFLEPSAPM